MSALNRRQAVGALGTGLAQVVLGTSGALAQANSPQAVIQAALGDGQKFGPTSVIDLARALARRPFVPAPNDLADVYSGLNYEQYVTIKARDTARLWESEGRGFTAEPLPRGFVFTTAVSLFTVEDGTVRRFASDRSRFDLGGLKVPDNAPDIGFSGFRLISANGSGQPFDFAIVQGATFFRARARGQNFGTVARGLTLKPAETRGEEFPFFRAFWLERPTAGSSAVVVHGLIDSDSVAGAVRMTFRPGETTIVDVETSLFPRVNLEHVGLGGMGATYLFGPNVRRTTDDSRPAVYEASGLQMLNGKGEWLWRPLNNPDTLQISSFVDESPKGFGLVQRERDFSFFQDDAQQLEKRPSVWIEPIGEWGPGGVQLLEIPSDSEINDNILAYWRPRNAMLAGSEVTVAYRQFWCWTPPERPTPALAGITGTRSGRGSSGRRRRFIVEFVGDALAQPVEGIRAALTTGPGTILGTRLFSYPERKSVRVAFELDPGSENACEMRLQLQAGGTPISETWLYRWTP